MSLSPSEPATRLTPSISLKTHDASGPPTVSRDSDPALFVVLGPTGSGKSDLAITLAEHLGGEIVNYDSVQIYRGFDIGSAKIPHAARRGVPHHLLDFADPQTEITAGSFAREARHILTEITARTRPPVLIGGTGFYLRALLDGLSPAPERNEDLRARLETLTQRRPAALHRFLRRFDSTAAARIHANDHQKLIRAIEMTFLAQRPASETQALPRSPLTGYRILKIGLDPDRKSLYARINQRSMRMFEQGLVTETEALLQSGVPTQSKPMQSLGYKQALAVLEGRFTILQAVEECQTKTRQYAKRQLTWFRREPNVHWLHGFGNDPVIHSQALQLATGWLGRTTAPK